jgi:membrane-bound ClpP family serine protease
MFWAWAILLLTGGLGLAILEIFFPSAGILGFLSAVAIVAAIILGFRDGPFVGVAILIVAVMGVPIVLIGALKVWPMTPMGRRVMLMSPKNEDVMPVNPRREHLKSFVGQIAYTKCEMMPGGAIIIDGRTVDAVSQGMAIEAGQPVRVIEVTAHRVVVRPLSAEEVSESAVDPMRRPIESVIPDPFEDSQG